MTMFAETIYDDNSQVLSVGSVVHKSRTDFQDVMIFDNDTFGRVLVLDGVVQLTERDHHVYHEMIAHVPIMTHGTAIDVLIVGGGDGGTLREVLRHPVRRVVMVEIDRDVIDLSRRHLAGVSSGAFNDSRAEIVIGDAASYVATTGERFDVIIIDSTDPVGPGERLFSAAFYDRCRALLRPGGIVSIQSGAPFFRPDELAAVIKRLGDCFGHARPYLAPVPTYARGLLPLILAGNEWEPLNAPSALIRARYARIRGFTRYYTPEVHEAAFTLVPAFVLSDMRIKEDMP